MIQKTMGIKAGVVGLLALLLQLPIGMISELVSERGMRQLEVVNAIGASSATAQEIVGPILVVAYRETWHETFSTASGEERRERFEQRRSYLLPESLEIAGSLVTEVKKRGIFKARTYVWDAQFAGSFRLPPGLGLEPEHNGTISHIQAGVAIGISDMRGILDAPTLTWDGVKHRFVQGANLPSAMEGVRVELPAAVADGTPKTVRFAIPLRLRGMESLSIVPVAGSTIARLSSDWAHPSFRGRFLPDPTSQSIHANGFEATWTVPALATNVADRISDDTILDSFSVSLIDPVDVYSLSDRASKYGFLFVGLTFGAFFLFEVLQRLAIHPAQYTLVGLALALFFLLLVSLSEHLTFATAYALAAAASATLIGFYLTAVLGGWRRGLFATSSLSALYCALYFLLQSEDHALVLGSMLLFTILGVAMMLTRRVDWYHLGIGIPPIASAEMPRIPQDHDGA